MSPVSRAAIARNDDSDDNSDDNGDNNYDDVYDDYDYDDDAYTDTKGLRMMVVAIMKVVMRDGVNIEKDNDDSDDNGDNNYDDDGDNGADADEDNKDADDDENNDDDGDFKANIYKTSASQTLIDGVPHSLLFQFTARCKRRCLLIAIVTPF